MNPVTRAGTPKVPAFYLDKTQLACAVCAAGLGVLAYPKAGIALLGWLVCAPLGLGLMRCRGGMNAAVYGWFAGLLFYAGLLYWLVPTCVTGGLNPALAALALMALAALLALEWVVFSVGAFKLFRVTEGHRLFAFLFPLAAALCWVCMEWLKQLLAQYLVWFPWFMLGYTQYQNEAVLQTAAFAGTYGISFLLAYFGFSAGVAVAWWRQERRRAALVILPAVLLGVFAWGAGRVRLAMAPPAGEPVPVTEREASSGHEKPLFTVALLQPNIEQYRKWDDKFEAFIYNRLSAQTELIEKTRLPSLKFVLWPESAVPGYIETPRYAGLVSQAARGTTATQILGAPSEIRGRAVSAFAFGPDGVMTGFYDKRKLVPFGEYVPLRSVLGRYVGVINQLGEFEPGDLRQPLIKADRTLIGAGICYEAIFPYLWRERAASGAQVFVSITNDGWYLATAGPYQHFAANVMRAAENGVPLVRAANTGISGGVDPWGRVTVRSDIDTYTVLFVPVMRAHRTVYSKYGDWFAALCLLVLGFMYFRLRRSVK